MIKLSFKALNKYKIKCLLKFLELKIKLKYKLNLIFKKDKIAI